jgi:purine-nucleoside phosphorylase
MTLPHQIQESVEFIGNKIAQRPTIGLILGSGLGAFADTLEGRVVLPYGEIPHFPVSHVAGHAGNLVIGKLGPHTVAVMQGRVHYYEGHSMETVVFPARVLVKLGCSRLVITNAAGGLGAGLKPGDLALISDHLNMLGTNPLRVPNFEDLGPRFPDMTNLYDPGLRALAKTAAARLGVTLKEGVYAAMLGPSYETPAEIRMMGVLGASMVGMSTVPEAIAAHHMGAKILGVSCVSNFAAGITPQPLSHAEVQETADAISATFKALVREIVGTLPPA